MNVLVTGATGLVGAHSIAELLRQNHTVSVLVRNPDKLSIALEPLGVDVNTLRICQGDITDRDTVKAAMADCDALVHAAGVFSDRLEDRELMQRTNVEGTATVLNAAVDARLDPIVHISSILALFPPPGQQQTAEDPVRNPKSTYAATKAAAENIARDLQQAGHPVVTVYPGAIQSPHDPTFSSGPQMIARYLRGGVLVTEGGLTYTDTRDLARLIAAVIEPGRGPRRYMFGGHYLRHEDLHALLSDLTGRELKAIRMPGWLMRLMGRASDLTSKFTGKPAQLTYEAALVLTQSVPCDDQPAQQEFGITPIPVEQSFRDLLIWMFQEGRLNPRIAGKLADTLGH